MRYMVPYVDMMTTLCIFFLLLYAFYLGYKTNKETAEGVIISAKVTGSIESDPMLKEAAKVVVLGDSVRIALQTSVMFGLGSAKLKPAILPPLIKLAETFRSLPADYALSVEGNTDNAPVFYGGDYTSNWELSLYRALSLIKLFTDEGNDPNRFSATGYSEYNPLYPNDTLEHQAANRRVEIVIRRRSSSRIATPAPAGVTEEKQLPARESAVTGTVISESERNAASGALAPNTSQGADL